MHQISKLVFAFCALFLLTQCGTDSNKPKTPDVSGIQAEVMIHRFDRDIAAVDTNNTEGGIQALEQKYPDFSRTYFERVIGIKDPRDTMGLYRNEVRKFLTDPSMRGMMDTIAMTYQKTDDLERQIKEGMRYFRHYFPKRVLPTHFYTMPSAYNFAVVLPSDTSVAIGLDLFLGAEHTTYKQLVTQFPLYISRTFRRDYLVKRVFELLVGDMAGEPTGNRLLDYMVHNGKKLYILDCLIPNTPDSIKLAFTAAQMKDSYANEGFTWGRILKQNLLYSARFADFQKMITPSPDANIIAAEAPGGIGNFIGWQIVKQYMQRNPNLSLVELLNQRDAQQILDASKYKPKKGMRYIGRILHKF